MASTHSEDESTEDKSKPDDMAVDSSAAAKDTRNSEPQEKSTTNGTAENTSDLLIKIIRKASAATEEKDAENTVESEPQAKENHIDVEVKEEAVDPSTDGKSTSKTVPNNKVKK